MPSLKDEVEARKAADAPPCYGTAYRTGNATFVEFRPDAHRRVGFPLSQLCHYSLDPIGGGELEAPERLTLGFSTADVVVTGARLGKLVELINAHDLAWVAALDARYAGTVGRGPWVASIAIARLDKPGGIPG